MKFGKSLSGQIVETLPEWRDKFLSYKDLKKQLKQIGAWATAMTPEEAGFVTLLDAELDKFNAFFPRRRRTTLHPAEGNYCLTDRFLDPIIPPLYLGK